MFAQPAGQRARVDAGDSGNAFAAQPIPQGASRAVVAVCRNVMLDDQTLNLDPVRLEGSIEATGGSGLRDAVVAGQWIGQDQDLPPVGGIGQGLDVARHPGVEYYFPDDRLGRSKTDPGHLGTILKH